MSQNFSAPPAPYSPPKPGSESPRKGINGGIIVLIIFAVLCCACAPVGGIGVALVLPAIQAAREAARRSTSTTNLKQIGLGLMNYHDIYKTYPSAAISDQNGTPRTSWRTSILPFIEQQPLYDSYDFNQAWDAPANARVRSTPLATYRSPRDAHLPDSRFTNYVVVRGPNTIFPPGEFRGMSSVIDGTSNTIAVVEILNSNIEWCEPRDLDIDSINVNPALPNCVHLERGALVLFADGSVKTIRPNSLEDFKILLNRNDSQAAQFMVE